MKLLRNDKAKSNPMSTLTIILVVMVLMMGVMAWAVFFKTPTASIMPGQSFGQQGTDTSPIVITTKNLFGDDNKGTYRPALISKYNSASTEYIGASMRLYKVNNGIEQYYATVVTQITGTATSGAGTTTIEGYDNDGNVQNYVAYVPANGSMFQTNGTGAGGFSQSARYTFSASEDVPNVEYQIANFSQLVFKVYDEDNRAYVYGTNDTNGTLGTTIDGWPIGTLYPSGAIFKGYNNNDTGQIIGTGGFLTYTIYFEVNGSRTTSGRWGDQRTLVAVDADDLSDWQEPVISMDGAVMTKLSSGQYNDKIKNDGYDYIYEVTDANGQPLSVDNQFKKLRLAMYAKSNVNPSDDIKVELFTAGYFKQTTGNDMLMDTHKDDSSSTILYPSQNVTLRIN